MYLRYGGYTHALDEASITITKQPLLSAGGNRLGFKEIWNVTGELFADNSTALLTALTALEGAYTRDGFDLALLANDGTTVTHALLTGVAQGGVKIEDWGYPEGRGGAELNTQRTYTFRASATYLLNTGFIYLSWSQTLAYTGTGGPRYVVREYRNGPPLLQRVSDYTPCYLMQSGSFESYQSNLSPPLPIYLGSVEDEPQRSITRSVRVANPTIHGVSWSYRFQSPTPL